MARPAGDRRTLTDAAVRSVPLPAAGRFDILDAACPGLVLRVSPTRKTWLRRADGKRTSIGTYPSVTLAEARKTCAEMRDSGTKAVTVEEAVNRFVKAHAVHLKSGDQLEWILHKHVVPHIGSRAVASISRADVAGLMRKVQGDDSTKRVRITNRVRGSLSRLLRWAVSEGLSPSNPAAMIERRLGEKSRDRVLTDEELRAVWLACEDVWPFGDIVRLLILTGQRRDEVEGIHWDEINAPAALWRLPAARMKAGRSHAVPLSSPALYLLCGGCIGARAFGGRPFRSWSTAKAKLDKASNTTGWVLHDIRRTVASGMVRLGVGRDIVAQVLGHVAPGATSVYVREGDLTAMRAALDRWAEHVEKIAAPRLDL